MERLRPTPRQLDFLSWEFGVFFHFGIRSFYRGSQDWDQQAMDLQAFDPRELDCRSWVRTAKEAGAVYAVLTAKHHDGFALWPTQHSPYSVKNTPWKDGQGDVVREFVEACRAEGVRPCLYYSPAQWGEGPRWDDPHAYDDYFEKQITELLTWYGPIDYLWFDGAFSPGHRYDKRRIVQRIRSLQPDILLFNLWDPDTRWIGNEAGFAPLDMRYVVNGLREEMCLGDADEPGSSTSCLRNATSRCAAPGLTAKTTRTLSSPSKSWWPSGNKASGGAVTCCSTSARRHEVCCRTRTQSACMNSHTHSRKNTACLLPAA